MVDEIYTAQGKTKEDFLIDEIELEEVELLT